MLNINFCKNTRRAFENDSRRIRKELGREAAKKQRDEVTRVNARATDQILSEPNLPPPTLQ